MSLRLLHGAFMFDLATPDPAFPLHLPWNFQLAGRPRQGLIDVAVFSRCFDLVSRSKNSTHWAFLKDLSRTRVPVLGPNVGEFLFQHQELIPCEFRGTVSLLFPGMLYRDYACGRFERLCCARSLDWRFGSWAWEEFYPDLNTWLPDLQIVALKASAL